MSSAPFLRRRCQSPCEPQKRRAHDKAEREKRLYPVRRGAPEPRGVLAAPPRAEKCDAHHPEIKRESRPAEIERIAEIFVVRVRDIRSERPPGLRHEARELDVQPRCRRARPAAEHGPLRNERADLAPDLHAVRAERAVRLARDLGRFRRQGA